MHLIHQTLPNELTASLHPMCEEHINIFFLIARLTSFSILYSFCSLAYPVKIVTVN